MPELVGPVVSPNGLVSEDQPTLQIDELTLRPFGPSDAPTLVRAYADPEIQRWHVRSLDDDEALEWIETSATRWQAQTGANWAVLDDKLVGRVGFRTITLHEGVAEVAYWTIPQARGRNIAARALQAVSAWALNDIGLHRLELNHSTANLASCRVAEKAGFTFEGIHRQQVLHQDGWHDMCAHSRIAGD